METSSVTVCSASVSPVSPASSCGVRDASGVCASSPSSEGTSASSGSCTRSSPSLKAMPGSTESGAGSAALAPKKSAVAEITESASAEINAVRSASLPLGSFIVFIRSFLFVILLTYSSTAPMTLPYNCHYYTLFGYKCQSFL